MARRHWFHTVLTALIASAVLFLLLRRVDLHEIPNTLRRLPWHVLSLGFLVYLVFVLTKAWRFRLILGLQIPFHRLFPILALQTFWTNLLPMRTGDLSYVYLLKQGENVAANKGVASLIVGSVVDMLLMLGLLIGLGGLFYSRFQGLLPVTTLFILPGIGMLLLASLSLPALFFPGSIRNYLEISQTRVQHCLEGVRKRTHPPIRAFLNLFDWMLQKIFGLMAELVQRPQGRQIVGILSVSAMSMVLRFSFQWYLIREMQIELQLSEVFFALAFTGFCNLFPIQSIAGLGTVEAPWTWALVSLGTTSQEAIISGMSLHLIVLLYSTGVGAIGWTMQRIQGIVRKDSP